MATLNFLYPHKSDIQFQTLTFPDGQPHLKIDAQSLQKAGKDTGVHIISRIISSNDLLLVLLAKDVLDREGYTQTELHISYLMGARMDRVMQPGEPFSLKVIAALINSAGFKQVHVFDPHSAATTTLLERSTAITNHTFVRDAIAHYVHNNQPSGYRLVSPDAGAAKKIHQLAAYLGTQDVVECSKVRDPKTGALSHFETRATGLEGQTCIIVDDICDGGGTFAGTACMLKKLGAAQIVLIVSHGIFSRGTTIESVDAIYTTDSYRLVDGVNCFEVGKYLEAL